MELECPTEVSRLIPFPQSITQVGVRVNPFPPCLGLQWRLAGAKPLPSPLVTWIAVTATLSQSPLDIDSRWRVRSLGPDIASQLALTQNTRSIA